MATTKTLHTPARYGRRIHFTSGALKGASVEVEAKHEAWLNAAAIAIDSFPDLLAACKAAESQLGHPVLGMVRAAIARAEGGQS